MNARRCFLCAGAALLFAVASFLGSAADALTDARSDVQLRAMLDELARAKTLKLNDLDKPYFVQYVSNDADQLIITASLGGLLGATHARFRQPRVDVRIGDYKFDNTNSIYTSNARLGPLPIDDDYQALRTDLWLSADALYKLASGEIVRKRSALNEIAEPDKTPDFSPVTPAKNIQPLVTLKLDEKHWEDVVRQISARFTAHPEVMDSHVRLRAIETNYRVVNTEGTIVRIPEELNDIAIIASGLAPDGSRVWNHRFLTELHFSELPKEQELSKAAEAVASETEALAKAPWAENYSGPVLFEQEAAAELMADILTDAIRLQRKPLAPPGSENSGSQMPIESVWASRVGSKVTPDWMSIDDNPVEEQFQGKPLAGHYAFDDEGVAAQHVTIVEKGVLKGFLSSRLPVGEVAASNGHGRLPGGWGAEAAVVGNLFVRASEAVPEAQLKARLIEKVKAANLKYGVVIRRLDFPSTANFQELQSIARQLQKNGYARTANVPLLAYRVYPDGHEELVRGWRFREFSAKDLRDVAAASDRPYVLNYVNNGSSFNLADAGSDATTSSVICPSLLFDNIDLSRSEEEAGRLPIVPPPALLSTP